MNMPDLCLSRVLAEVLRLQRWAGGDTVAAARIFGLMHGFESVIRQEGEGSGVSEETQEKVEALLEQVEAGEQCSDGPAIKDRLHRDKIGKRPIDC